MRASRLRSFRDNDGKHKPHLRGPGALVLLTALLRLMSASQRLKGQRGERELFGELSERLGVVVRRNIGQTRGGGPDGLDIPGWAIECKFQDKVFAPAWWNQTLRQAEDTGRRPILFYRKTGNRTWKARLRVDDLCLYRFGVMGDMETAEVSLDVAAAVIRETLP